MQDGNQSVRRNVYRQFSLSMLLLLVTGIACFLGGRIYGYRQGIAVWDSVQLRERHFDMSDLFPNLDGSKSIAPLELFAKQIKNELMPGVWSELGGKASLDVRQPSFLRVIGNPIVIEGVDQYVMNLRNGPNLKYAKK